MYVCDLAAVQACMALLAPKATGAADVEEGRSHVAWLQDMNQLKTQAGAHS